MHYKNILRVLMVTWLIAASLFFVVASASAQTVSIGTASADAGTTTTVEIRAQNIDCLGNFGITLTYDPDVVIVTNATLSSELVSPMFNLDNAAEGYVELATLNLGLTDPIPCVSGADVLLVTVELEAVGEVGDTSDLGIVIGKMVHQNSTNFDATPITGTFTVGTGEPQTLGSVVISPSSADLLIPATKQFTAKCYDTRGNPMSGSYTLTWNCDTDVVGTIDSSGLFTAGGVGTATVTVSATYEGVTKTDTAIVNVSAPPTRVHVDGTDFPETSVNAGTAANITVNGTFDNSVTGNITWTVVANPEENVSSYTLTDGNDEALIGLVATHDDNVLNELEDGNDTIRIQICYNATALASEDIDPSTLAIWRYNVSTGKWDKMVKGTPPCVDNGITGTCVWIEVDNLSTFALVGTKTAAPSGGGGGGTYPPGWGTTTTATPAVTATAVSTATPGVTPPEEAVTTPTKPAAEEETPAVVAEETPTKKKGIPGFTAVFAIAGLLAIAYAMMRRRD